MDRKFEREERNSLLGNHLHFPCYSSVSFSVFRRLDGVNGIQKALDRGEDSASFIYRYVSSSLFTRQDHGRLCVSIITVGNFEILSLSLSTVSPEKDKLVFPVL